MLRLHQLPTELHKRGFSDLMGMYWDSKDLESTAFWAGILTGIAQYKPELLTGDELLGFCLELQATGIDESYLKELKHVATERRNQQV